MQLFPCDRGLWNTGLHDCHHCLLAFVLFTGVSRVPQCYAWMSEEKLIVHLLQKGIKIGRKKIKGKTQVDQISSQSTRCQVCICWQQWQPNTGGKKIVFRNRFKWPYSYRAASYSSLVKSAVFLEQDMFLHQYKYEKLLVVLKFRFLDPSLHRLAQMPVEPLILVRFLRE